MEIRRPIGGGACANSRRIMVSHSPSASAGLALVAKRLLAPRFGHAMMGGNLALKYIGNLYGPSGDAQGDAKGDAQCTLHFYDFYMNYLIGFATFL